MQPNIKPKQKVVQEYNWGLWVWQRDGGEIFGDDEGNVMSTPGLRNDREAVKRITEAARHYGAGEGTPVFWQGKRQITDDEFEEQKARSAAGLVADPFDIGAINDEMKAIKYNHGKR